MADQRTARPKATRLYSRTVIRLGALDELVIDHRLPLTDEAREELETRGRALREALLRHGVASRLAQLGPPANIDQPASAGEDRELVVTALAAFVNDLAAQGVQLLVVSHDIPPGVDARIQAAKRATLAHLGLAAREL